jgi:hypothetical protein
MSRDRVDTRRDIYRVDHPERRPAWVPEMGFLLSECELQAILLIYGRYVTLVITSVTYRRVNAPGGGSTHYGTLVGWVLEQEKHLVDGNFRMIVF